MLNLQRNAFTSIRTPLAAAALALVGASMSSHAATEVFTSGTSFFKRVITNTSVNTTSATTFADLPGGTTTIFVPANSAVMVTVDFNAEAACYGGGANNPNWCEMMVLINGVEASPKSSTTSLGDTFSFASTDNGAASTSSWRAHSFSRHTCVRNTTSAPLAVPVAIQWKILQFGTATSTFWIDDSAMTVQMSSNCTATTSAS
jgi:hypothetical protein